MTEDVYERLAEHYSTLGMGCVVNDDFIDILKEMFTPEEAEVVLLLPTKVAPFKPASVDDIIGKTNIPRAELEDKLEKLTQRMMIFSGKTEDGKKGYALLQLGYGFPQSSFWKGKDTPYLRNMAGMVVKYFNRRVTSATYGGSETKPFRYIPVGETVDTQIQGVYHYDMMENIIDNAKVIAVCHCPCRLAMQLRGKGCEHALEVCLKYGELAEYVIERGIGREITKEEALKICKDSEEAGMVHMVDNAMGEVKHTCHCCGCACWNVGAINRRKIPRDVLMATYYLRYTDKDECMACGDCIDICPVNALTLDGDYPTIDEEWCIGCGVCIVKCLNGAAKLRLRPDRKDVVPPSNFEELHETILKEKGLKGA